MGENIGNVIKIIGAICATLGLIGGAGVWLGMVHSDTSQNSESIAAIKEDLSYIRSDLTDLKEDVATVKRDVNILKEDVSVLKVDVTTLKIDVGAIKGKLNLAEQPASL